MFQNVLGNDGQMHLENQVGNMRFDLTTGEMKTVIPSGGTINLVLGKDGAQTEINSGHMRQTLGKPGFEWKL